MAITAAQIADLCDEIRVDNQVPPYTPDAIIERSIQRCAARLDALRPDTNFSTDLLARGYLKEFVGYDMLHRGEEFLQNYGDDIRSWQLSEEIADEDDEDEEDSGDET